MKGPAPRLGPSGIMMPAMTLAAGEVFAGYTIVRPLGAGGMGQVYLARHPRLPKNVALKLLASPISADRAFRERFIREADLAANLYHPHIVGVQDRGEDNGQLWIAMDYVDGVDAAQLMNTRYPAGMDTELATGIAAAVADALDYAHKRGLLHRDIKPANIILAHHDDPAERRILLTDFGIARELNTISGLTDTNMTLGTVAYTAPEQLMGQDIDSQADQYSLAATTYSPALHHSPAPTPPSSSPNTSTTLHPQYLRFVPNSQHSTQFSLSHWRRHPPTGSKPAPPSRRF